MNTPEDLKALKKLHNTAICVPGTKLNAQNAQLLVSTGIPSLDNLLGGGIGIGTIFLVEEDSFGSYGKVLVKYFLAEGVVNNHAIFITSHDLNTKKLVLEIPSAVESDPMETGTEKRKHNEQMSIAWRYQHLPTANEEQVQCGHYFDLSKHMDPELMKKADIQHWDPKEYNPKPIPAAFANPAYHGLLQSIKNAITSGKHDISTLSDRKTVLRIALHSVGSPYWLADRRASPNLLRDQDLDMFMYCLKALLQSTYAVAMITVPSEIMEKDAIGRCVHIADTGIRLESFMATKNEENPALSDYHGFFHVTKVPAINTLEPVEPCAVDLAFKLRRKKFVIEKLHLPPELEETKQREQEEPVAVFNCSRMKSRNLEF